MRATKPKVRRRAVLQLLALFILIPFGAQPALAEDAYQYWSYWWGSDGSWQYAQSGPADRIVADGDVEGWLWLVSAEAEPSQRPQQAPDFAALCGSEAAPAGQVRVGVVIDFGEPEAAPSGSQLPDANPQTQCVTVPENSTGQQVIEAAAQVRTENGLTCGIAGYPATGCGGIVAAPTDEGVEVEAADEPTPAPGFPIWAGLAGLLALTAVVVVLVLRRKKQPTA